MTVTPYSTTNGAFTDAAHKAAQTDVYPHLFPGADLAYERVTGVHTDVRHKVLDGELGIDLMLNVDLRLAKPLRFTVQERFRKIAFRSYRDMTITEWNLATGQPSELYKLASDLFVYGYYDEANDRVTEALVMYSAPLKHAIATGDIAYEQRTNPRSRQRFIALTFADLHARGLVKAHIKPGVRKPAPKWTEAFEEAFPADCELPF